MASYLGHVLIGGVNHCDSDGAQVRVTRVNVECSIQSHPSLS